MLKKKAVVKDGLLSFLTLGFRRWEETSPGNYLRRFLAVFAGRLTFILYRMNQNPEQLARDRIDAQLTLCGLRVQDKKSLNILAAVGIIIREYSTDIDPAGYVLFVNKKPVGVIDAKSKEGVGIMKVKQQQIIQEIESRISVCDKIEETITASLKQAEALRQSILKGAFQGKLI